jgi:hypothetical protein
VRKPSSGAWVGAIIGTIALVVLLFCGGIIGVGWYFWSMVQSAATARTAGPGPIAAWPPGGAGPVDNGPPQDAPIEIPPGWIPGGMPPEFRPILPNPGEPPDREPPRPPAEPVFLPPPRVVFGLRPAPFTGDRRTVSLPAPVADLAVGGGGRFVILHLSGERKLAVFDVNAATIVRYIPLRSDDIAFAAGMDALLVAVRNENVLERYSLENFEREASWPLPVPAGALCMGSAASGPLLVEPVPPRPDDPFGRSAGITFIDPQTGKTLAYDIDTGNRHGPAGFHGYGVRAAANGTAFACRGGWQGATCLVLGSRGGRVATNEDAHTQMAWPSPDGRYVYTDTAICTSEMRLVHKPANPGQLTNSPFLPAVEGPFALHLIDHSMDHIFNPGSGRTSGLDIEFLVAGRSRPFHVWKDFETGPHTQNIEAVRPRASALSIEKRLLFVPGARVLLFLPPPNDKLILHRFDPDELLAKWDQDHVLVTSSPPPAAGKGTTFSYVPQIRSKKGGVTIKLESAPGGMSLGPDGKLTWNVPGDFAEREADVLLSLRDDSGQEAFHSFRLAIVDGNALPKAIAVDAAVAPGPPVVIRPPAAEKPPEVKPAGPLLPSSFRVHLPKGEQEEVALSGPADDVATGGGGRFLLLHLADQLKLAVFDVQEGKVVKELPMADEVIRYAAGATHVVVLYPNARTVQLWNLATLAKERQAPLPSTLTRNEIKHVCMGSASRGPLFAYLPREKRTQALDLNDLTTTEVRWTHYGANNAYGPLYMRASPDGSVLLGWHGGWAGLEMLTFRGSRQTGAVQGFEFSAGLFALPSPDARLIYTPWAIYTRDLKPAKVPALKDAYLVPAAEPGFFLALRGRPGQDFPTAPGDRVDLKLPPMKEALVYTEDRKYLFTLDDAAELHTASDLHWEKRVHYYPLSGLLVTLTEKKDRLVLRRVDLGSRLERSRSDYLLVASKPPPARAGTTFSYPLDIRSRKGGVKIKLESGPEGLQVSPEGRVTWAIPANFGEPEVEVQLTISDASGQETFHNFKIALAAP